jgi:hypothetical protein
VVGQDAIDDALNSGLVRSNTPTAGVYSNGMVRTTPYPSFAEGKPRQIYIDQTINQGKTPYIISTDRPMKISTLGRHGKGSTRFPVNNHGEYIPEINLSEVNLFQGTPHW